MKYIIKALLYFPHLVLMVTAFVVMVLSLCAFLALDQICIWLTGQRSKRIMILATTWICWLSWPFEPSGLWVLR